MQVVLLDKTNAHLLDNVAQGVFDGDIQSEQLHAFLNCHRHCMLLAVADGLVVGMISGVEYFHPDKPPQLWINEISVAPRYRKQGVGRQLTATMLEIAQQRGCSNAWLGTDISNHSAQQCFGGVPHGKQPTQFLLYEWEIKRQNAT